MDAVLEQAKLLASNVNEASRKKIMDGLRDLSYSLGTEDDTVQRIMSAVRTCSSTTNNWRSAVVMS